jgi:hypothetical protein
MYLNKKTNITKQAELRQQRMPRKFINKESGRQDTKSNFK